MAYESTTTTKGTTTTTAAAAHESIALKLKNNKHKMNACTLYVHGQTKLARQYYPQYIDSLEKRNEHKTDFLFGILFFVLIVLGIVYYVIPRVGASQLAILTLFFGVFSSFFTIEYVTGRIRSSRMLHYLESKEIPKLRREIETQKMSIETLMEQNRELQQKEARRQRKQRSKQSHRHKSREDYEEWLRTQREEVEEERRRREGTETKQDGEDTKVRFACPKGRMTSKDALRILNLPAGLSLDEIQKAYRKAIAQYHPDRVAHLAPEFQRLAEKRTKIINEAYQYLKGLFNK